MSEPQMDLSQVDRSHALYERPPVAVADPQIFNTVKSAVEGSFAPHNVERFLRSLERAGLRIRDFEAVLAAGKLGVGTAVEYGKLTDGDQGQIREFYLASLEKVEIPLRDKHFKLYAYY
ncbi:MAG TPA: hypothetical protein VHY48_04700 [Acidobacteriaceae bacterium]|jgi:hypothetical protein|nr:hypothetical protein [Acidobacteriaceae bacterium]